MRDFMKRLIEGSDEMLKGQTSIIDWFDPKNEKHMKAFAVLEKTGKWPRQFIPGGLEFPRKWKTLLTEKVNEDKDSIISQLIKDYKRYEKDLSSTDPKKQEYAEKKVASLEKNLEKLGYDIDQLSESNLQEALPGEEDPVRKKPDPATDEAPEDEVLDNDMDDEELMGEEPAEVDFEKLYLGRTGDKHFYLVANKNEEGVAEDLQVVDQEGELVYSAEEQGLEVADVAAFIKAAIKDVDILTIERNVILRYLVPEEEARIEDEDLENGDEELPDDLQDEETGEENDVKKNSSVPKKSPFESKETELRNKKSNKKTKVKEKKLGLDYVTQVKKNTKKAVAALKDKDSDAAAAALDQVADDASDASKALKKMKAVEEEELADANAKKREELDEANPTMTTCSKCKETLPTKDFEKPEEQPVDEAEVNEEDIQETNCNEVASKLQEDDEFNRLVQAQLADPDNSDAKEAVNGYVQKVWGDVLNNDAQAVSNVVERATAILEEKRKDSKKKDPLPPHLQKAAKAMDKRLAQGKDTHTTISAKESEVAEEENLSLHKKHGLRQKECESNITETNITDEKGNSFSVQIIDEGDSDVTVQINQREFHFKPDFAKLFGVDESGQLTDEAVQSIALETIKHLDETEYAELIGSGKVKEKSGVEEGKVYKTVGEGKYIVKDGKTATVKAIKEGNVSVNIADDAGAALNVNITGEANINIGADGSIEVIPIPAASVELPINPDELGDEVPAEEEIAGAPGAEEEAPEIPGAEEEKLEDEFESKNKKKFEMNEPDELDEEDPKICQECGDIITTPGYSYICPKCEGIGESKIDEEKINELTTWVDLGWKETPDLSKGWKVRHKRTGKIYDIASTDEKFIQLVDPHNDIEGNELPVGDGFAWKESEWELLDDMGDVVDIHKTQNEKCKKSKKESAEDGYKCEGCGTVYDQEDKLDEDKKCEICVAAAAKEGIGDQTKEVFEVEFVRDGKPDKTRVMAYDEAAAKKMLEEKPSVDEVTGCKQISGLDEKDDLAGSPEVLAQDEDPEVKPEEDAGEGEYVVTLVASEVRDTDEEIGRFATPAEAAAFMEDKDSELEDTLSNPDRWGEDPEEGSIGQDEVVKLTTPEGKEYFWAGGWRDTETEDFMDEEPDEDTPSREAVESAKKLLGLDNVDEFKVEETIKVGDTVMVCNDSLKCVIEEATVYEIDEKKGFELTGNTIPEEQEWYNTEYFQIDKL